MLCHYDGIIVLNTNSSITYINGSTIFLNGTRNMSFKDTKQVIYERLGLNYNDVEIVITCKCLVEKHQYFSVPITYDVDFENMMELFVQSGTNIIELYMSN
jgi:hypothetical protein